MSSASSGAPPNHDGVISLDELPPCARAAISRRGFCAAAGAGLISLGLSACDQPPSRITVGPIDDAPPDAGNNNRGDLGQSSDLAQSNGNSDLTQTQNGCPSSAVNCGPASALAVNQAKLFSSAFSYSFYLCRDSGGLFSVDSACTHSGCTVQLSSGSWFCPCHGARFSFDGQNPTSPAPTPLNNYAVCVDAGGTAWVDYNTVVSPTTRA